MTRLADNAPAYCAACFQHDGELRHVDFEAAYDGPVIPGSPAPTPVDDLVICERCLESAFAILDPEGQTKEIERLNAEVTRLQIDVDAKDKAIHSAQETITELVDHPINKPPGRRAFMVSDPEVKHQLSSQRDKRAKEKVRG